MARIFLSCAILLAFAMPSIAQMPPDDLKAVK
jgi:hypothetical protein